MSEEQNLVNQAAASPNADFWRSKHTVLITAGDNAELREKVRALARTFGIGFFSDRYKLDLFEALKADMGEYKLLEKFGPVELTQFLAFEVGSPDEIAEYKTRFLRRTNELLRDIERVRESCAPGGPGLHLAEKLLKEFQIQLEKGI